MAAIGLLVLVWAHRRQLPGVPFKSPDPRRANPLLVVVFVFLCLYPLGIPTSWTRANIEAIRAEEPLAGTPLP
jgi:phosphatidylglycerol:prolipoprotein diacylglycerol transferase